MTNEDYTAVCAFLYHEARHLDDRDWDQWLACYDPAAEFWMPSWTDDDTLTEDPQSQISLIYYPDRKGLEDRVYRIRTERSSASMPEPRTAHMIANVEILREGEGTIDLRFNWLTSSHRARVTSQFFGTSFYTLGTGDSGYRILRKKVVLKDDYIHQVIDIYHV